MNENYEGEGTNSNTYSPDNSTTPQYGNGYYNNPASDQTNQAGQTAQGYSPYQADQTNQNDYATYQTNQTNNNGYSPYQVNQPNNNGYSPYQANGSYQTDQSANQAYNQQYQNPQYQNPQMNGTQDMNYQPYNTGVVPNKKKSHKWLWGFSAIPVLAIGLMLAFFFIPSFQDFVYGNLLGSKLYYKHVEDTCSEKVKDEVTGLLSTNKVSAKDGYSVKGDMFLSLDSSLTGELGFDISDIKVNYSSSVKDKQSVASFSVDYKGSSLLTYELYSDTEDGSMYVKVPTLSDKYIDYSALLSQLYSSGALDSELPSSLLNLSTTSLTGVTPTSATSSISQQYIASIMQSLATKLDPETISNLLTDYSDYILDEIKKKGSVSLEKSATFEVSDSKQKCKAFTISLSEQDVYDLFVDVLKKAQSDETILDIVKSAIGSDTLYTSGIDSLLSSLEEDKDTIDKDNDSFLKMTVYTDGNQILGREFALNEDDDSVTIRYGMLTSDDAASFVFEVLEDDSEILGVSMDSKKSGDAYDGDIHFYGEGDDYSVSFTGFSINDKGLMTGNFTIPIESDSSLAVKLSADDSVQTMNFAYTQSGTELGSLTATCSTSDNANIDYPEISKDSVASVTDGASLAAYIDQEKLEAFLQNLIDTFNIPTTESAKDLAAELIAEISSNDFSADDLYGDDNDSYGDSYGDDNDDYYGDDDDDDYSYGNDDSDSNSSYNPEDYDLPAGTEIDEYGYYRYDLTSEDLANLKQQGAAYPSFAKTYTDLESYFDSLATKMYGSNSNSYSSEYNYVSGCVDDGYESTYHYTTVTWYSSDKTSDYMCVSYDNLTGEVISLMINSCDTKNLSSYIKDLYKNLGATAIPDDEFNTFSSLIKQGKDCSESYTASDSYLCIVSSTDDDSTSYYVRIGKDDTIY